MPCPPPGDLPDPGIKPMSFKSPALAVGFLPLVPPGKSLFTPRHLTQMSAFDEQGPTSCTHCVPPGWQVRVTIFPTVCPLVKLPLSPTNTPVLHILSHPKHPQEMIWKFYIKLVEQSLIKRLEQWRFPCTSVCLCLRCQGVLLSALLMAWGRWINSQGRLRCIKSNCLLFLRMKTGVFFEGWGS